MNFFKNLFGNKKEQEKKSGYSVNKKESLDKDMSPTEVAELLLNVLPRINVDLSHEIYKNEKQASLTGSQMPFEMNIPEEQQPVVKKLYADLSVTFAVDKGAVFELVQKKVLKSKNAINVGLNEEALWKLSINNLIEKVSDKIQLNGDADQIIMVTAGGNFEATLILIENFWQQIHKILNGNAIVAIPAKDLLLITKENNSGAIEKLKEMIRDFHAEPDSQGLLSKALYLKKPDENKMSIYETAF